MRNFINLADIDKKELRKIIDHAKSLKEKKTDQITEKKLFSKIN